MLYLAADHAGYEMKEAMKSRLEKRGVAFEDFGPFQLVPDDDYVGPAKKVAKAVVKSKGRGILFCGSGQGMAMTANRFQGVRAAVVWGPMITVETREDNDANIISLPARFIDEEKAWEVISAFLSTSFSHIDRHKRRIKQIDAK